MKFVAFVFLFVAKSVLACDLSELRKEVFAHFEKGVPLENQLGEKKATTVLKEFYLTDSMMRMRGEEFFITRMVFDIVFPDGTKHEKEMLLAAVVDLASCKVESYESGDVLGSTVSVRP